MTENRKKQLDKLIDKWLSFVPPSISSKIVPLKLEPEYKFEPLKPQPEDSLRFESGQKINKEDIDYLVEHIKKRLEELLTEETTNGDVEKH